MKNKLNSIMLIDDNEADNYYNQMVIEEMNCANEVVIHEMANDALNYLKTKTKDGDYPNPNLIFLDINMPGMNGWEFLDAYEKLEAELRKSIIVVMLTTSLNPDDHERAKKYTSVKEYRNKPLSEEILNEIIKQYC